MAAATTRWLGCLLGVVACSRGANGDVPAPVESLAPGAAPSTVAVEHRVDDGRELIGTQAKPWRFDGWLQGGPLAIDGLRGKVVVVRFWTTGCPYCASTMPALQALSKELADEPVVFVGAFHEKPVGSAKDGDEALALARRWGVTFPLAFDRGWRTLNDWYMVGFRRRATSTTFVIDKAGTVVHVHPGPEFFPSDDPVRARENADYQAVRAAIATALRAPPPSG